MTTALRARVIGAACLLTIFSAAAFAQLASRPADDWIKVLDSPERLASLKVAEVVAALQLRPGDVVADLGAGSGPFIPAFARAVTPKGRVYAVEIDKAFFPHIEAKARAAGAANVRVVLGEFTDPKLPAADVDVVFLHDVLHHIADRPAYLANAVKYLKPAARIAIVDYNPANSPHSGDATLQVSKQQAAAWLAPLGFTPTTEVQLAADKWFVIYGRQPATAAANPEEAAILSVVDRFMDGITSNDAALLAELHVEGSFTVVARPGASGGGPQVVRRAFTPPRSNGRAFRERYWDPVVHVRGGIAVVWTPYEFWIDGKTSHCGIDVFDLMKDNGVWKIANAMWTVEPDACPALRPSDPSRVRPVSR